MFHLNVSPRNGIILPRGRLCPRSPGTRHGQCTEKQPVFPPGSLKQSPASSSLLLLSPEMKRVLFPLASPSQWHSHESCVLCQRLCLLHSSEMLRKINDGGGIPASTGLRAWCFCSYRSKNPGSPRPWNFRQHSYIVLCFCYLKLSPFRL